MKYSRNHLLRRQQYVLVDEVVRGLAEKRLSLRVGHVGAKGVDPEGEGARREIKITLYMMASQQPGPDLVLMNLTALPMETERGLHCLRKVS